MIDVELRLVKVLRQKDAKHRSEHEGDDGGRVHERHRKTGVWRGWDRLNQQNVRGDTEHHSHEEHSKMWHRESEVTPVDDVQTPHHEWCPDDDTEEVPDHGRFGPHLVIPSEESDGEDERNKTERGDQGLCRPTETEHIHLLAPFSAFAMRDKVKGQHQIFCPYANITEIKSQ